MPEPTLGSFFGGFSQGLGQAAQSLPLLLLRQQQIEAAKAQQEQENIFRKWSFDLDRYDLQLKSLNSQRELGLSLATSDKERSTINTKYQTALDRLNQRFPHISGVGSGAGGSLSPGATPGANPGGAKPGGAKPGGAKPGKAGKPSNRGAPADVMKGETPEWLKKADAEVKSFFKRAFPKGGETSLERLARIRREITGAGGVTFEGPPAKQGAVDTGEQITFEKAPTLDNLTTVLRGGAADKRIQELFGSPFLLGNYAPGETASLGDEITALLVKNLQQEAKGQRKREASLKETPTFFRSALARRGDRDVPPQDEIAELIARNLQQEASRQQTREAALPEAPTLIQELVPLDDRYETPESTARLISQAGDIEQAVSIYIQATYNRMSGKEKRILQKHMRKQMGNRKFLRIMNAILERDPDYL